MAEKYKQHQVPAKQLRWDPPDEGWHEFETTEEVQPCKHIIGQDRAEQAIMLGLESPHVGYNVFVTGLSGTGRMTTIELLLKELETENSPPDDWCYLNNFKDSDRPRAIQMPFGEGKKFSRSMDKFIEDLKEKVPAALESEAFQKTRRQVIDSSKRAGENLFKSLEEKVRAAGFTLGQYQMGSIVRPVVIPLINDKPTSLDDLRREVSEGKFSEERFEELRKQAEELGLSLAKTLREARQLEKSTTEALLDLEQELFGPFVDELIDDLKEAFPIDGIGDYFAEVRDAVLDDVEHFKRKDQKEVGDEEDSFWMYRVNLIVDNSETKGKPIIIEGNPTYKNLFGTVEKIAERGSTLQQNFSNIKAGSLLRANGGFIIINALDAIIEPGVWQVLKRALRNLELEIQSYDPFFFMAGSALQPQPIPLDAKVIFVGDRRLYYMLLSQDPEFKKIFKIHAPFDSEMDLNSDSMCAYAAFTRKIVDEEKLLPFTRNGIKAVMQESVRHSGKKTKLSTRFHLIADLLREANFWAKKEEEQIVTDKHVNHAVEAHRYRLGMVNEKMHEYLMDGTVMVDTEGEKVGQVNGLAVYDMGETSFGKPTRITARVGLGKPGVINIEREADLSGPIHNKAVLILTGYMQGKYALEYPLTMSVSLGFEQSYGGVDGDSATAAEVYAILSALTNIPLKQSIALTGSVNQHGEIQPIGGVNDKIEGFFDLCKDRDLTGDQGVIIPHQNVKNLMLRQDVVDAVNAGKFTIWATKNVEDGLEILTGRTAGKMRKDGNYPKGSINAKVLDRIKELYDLAKRTGKDKDNDEAK